jgi:HK97 family phage portal protein
MGNTLKRVQLTAQTALAAWKMMRFPGSGGGSGSARFDWQGKLVGTNRDYAALAGDMWQNSAVAACLNWMISSFQDAVPRVFEEQADGKLTPYQKHALNDLLLNPNPAYDDTVLWAGTLISFMVRGNGYWRIVWSRRNQPIELWYVPHRFITPRWPTDGTKFIGHYDFTIDGQTEAVPLEEMVHFRFGLNPYNQREGMSPLDAVRREVFNDNEATNYGASILANMGIVTGIASPKNADEVNFDPKKFAKMWKEKTSGDNRGEMFATDTPLDIFFPDATPEKMALDVLRKYPEARICAVLGIPAMLVGLTAGLERSTFSNYSEARKAAWQDTLLPTGRIMGRQLTRQLLRRMPEQPLTFQVGFDTSKIDVLQPDQDALHKRAREDWKSNLVTRAEARTAIGLESTPDDEVYFAEVAGAVALDEEDDKKPADAKKGQKALSHGEDTAIEKTDWAARVTAELDILHGSSA